MTRPNQKDIYSPQYVKALFDRMSKTYTFSNYVTSFGFSERWRRQCVDDLPEIAANATGYDLMSGMGESWPHILKRLDENGTLIAVDISDKMNKKALAYKQRQQLHNVQIKKTNLLQNDIPSHSADFIVSTFGLKTFNDEQMRRFAQEINRILKPGGVFSLVEISEPKGWLLNGLYMFYIDTVIPLIGRFLLHDPESYQMLGRYCKRFGDCRQFHHYLTEEGLQANYKTYFHGCATGVYGRKQMG